VTATVANNITQNVIQTISGEFDEVTYNPSANLQINLFSFSQDFSQWLSGASTITANAAISPDGTRTATQLTATAAFANRSQSLNGVNQQTYTASIFAKYVDQQFLTLVQDPATTATPFAYYDLLNGVVNASFNCTARIVLFGNGWYRCIMTFVYNSSTMSTLRPRIWLGTYTSTNFTPTSILIWGAQLEQASNVSIYVPTGANTIIANTFNQRTTSTGNTYIRGTYDEYSKMSPITEGLIFNIDPGYDTSYTGSGSTMYDTTQNRYRVDLSGSPPYSSDFGGILKFTSTFGNNAWGNTSIPSGIITTTSNYTMSAWVKCNPTMKGLAETSFYNLATSAIVSPQANTGYSYGSTGIILGNNNYGGYSLFWATRINNNGIKELTFGLSNRINTPSSQFASPSYSVTLNNSAVYLNWTHIVGVYNTSGNFCGFYVNGVLVNSTTTSQMSVGSFPLTYSTLRICSDGITGGSPTGRNFDGDTGPMCIWNRALANTEVQQMYNSQRSRFGV